MTPSVPSQLFPRHNNLFDSLDHTYRPETFLSHVKGARVLFQFESQPLGIQSFLQGHFVRMPLLNSFLPGIAPLWSDRLLQFNQMIGVLFLKSFKDVFDTMLNLKTQLFY